MADDIQGLMKTLDYTFDQPELLRRAMTHRSAGGAHYERLEFLGDSVLSFMISERIYAHFPAADEGDLSRVRARLVKGDTLAEIASEMGLSGYLRMGSGEMKSGGRRRESVMADAVEAIIGALYLDGGLEPCQALVDRYFQPRLLALPPLTRLKDPKTRLQEYLQGRRRPRPEYELVESVNNNATHASRFVVHCSVDGIDQPVRGEGETRRKAEQAAAEAALEQLGA